MTYSVEVVLHDERLKELLDDLQEVLVVLNLHSHGDLSGAKRQLCWLMFVVRGGRRGIRS